MGSLTVTSWAEGPRTVIALAGELTIGTVQSAEQAIHQARVEYAEHLVFDLGALEFLDSMGLRTLVKFYLAAEGRGGSAALAGPLAPRVGRALHMTGLDRRLPLHPTLTDALAASPPDRPTGAAPRPTAPSTTDPKASGRGEDA